MPALDRSGLELRAAKNKKSVEKGKYELIHVQDKSRGLVPPAYWLLLRLLREHVHRLLDRNALGR